MNVESIERSINKIARNVQGEISVYIFSNIYPYLRYPTESILERERSLYLYIYNIYIAFLPSIVNAIVRQKSINNVLKLIDKIRHANEQYNSDVKWSVDYEMYLVEGALDRRHHWTTVDKRIYAAICTRGETVAQRMMLFFLKII